MINNKLLESLLGLCIVRDKDNNIVYPDNSSKLDEFYLITKAEKDSNTLANGKIFCYENKYYEYQTKTISMDGESFYVETLSDISNILQKLTDHYSNIVMEYRKDDTTGLDGKGLAFEKFDNYLTNVISRNNSFACITIDADFFKRVNDTYGHYIGDMILKNISKILLSSTRNQDIVGRIGGEEFLIVLKSISYEDALQKAEEIRLKAASSVINVKGKLIKSPTLSLGLNYVDSRDIAFQEDIEELRKKIIEDSDIACYESKEKGRNQVSVFTPKKKYTNR